jgi:RecJ-like exonuclease
MTEKKCEACDGRGHLFIQNTPTCGVCDGTGKVEKKEIGDKVALKNNEQYDATIVGIIDNETVRVSVVSELFAGLTQIIDMHVDDICVLEEKCN